MKPTPAAQTDDKSVRGLQTRAYREIMGGTFPELPETEDEVRAIKELLKAPDQSQPLLVKDAASRSTIFSLNQDARLSAYRYLVFACHGILPGGSGPGGATGPGPGASGKARLPDHG